MDGRGDFCHTRLPRREHPRWAGGWRKGYTALPHAGTSPHVALEWQNFYLTRMRDAQVRNETIQAHLGCNVLLNFVPAHSKLYAHHKIHNVCEMERSANASRSPNNCTEQWVSAAASPNHSSYTPNAPGRAGFVEAALTQWPT